MENDGVGEKEVVFDDGRVSRGARRRARLSSGAKFGFYIHLFFFIAVNLLLLFINAMTTPLVWWSLFAVMGWAVALFFHAMVSFLVPHFIGARRRLYKQELSRRSTN